jgi:hypothetical protein
MMSQDNLDAEGEAQSASATNVRFWRDVLKKDLAYLDLGGTELGGGGRGLAGSREQRSRSGWASASLLGGLDGRR